MVTHFAYACKAGRGRGVCENRGDGCTECDTKGELSMPVATSAEDFLPSRLNLSALRKAAAQCKGCDLYKNATQTVFGEGPRPARIILLGEVPGDEEDRQGKPFVGPAGRLLDDSLDEAGISRDDVYVTNVVKHFRWERRGKRRLHKNPPPVKSRPAARGFTLKYLLSNPTLSSAWAPPLPNPCSGAIFGSPSTGANSSTATKPFG